MEFGTFTISEVTFTRFLNPSRPHFAHANLNQSHQLWPVCLTLNPARLCWSGPSVRVGLPKAFFFDLPFGFPMHCCPFLKGLRVFFFLQAPIR